MEIRPGSDRQSAMETLASSIAIRAAATEYCVARPSCSTARWRIHRSGSKSSTSQPFAWSNPSTSNTVIGLAPLLPARSPRRNSSTPIPILETTPRPVITTLRGLACPDSAIPSPSSAVPAVSAITKTPLYQPADSATTS
ncbi:hypothetical protein SANTM175S_10133 [Streptomyces antimycoticus]